jgi:cytochrome P450
MPSTSARAAKPNGAALPPGRLHFTAYQTLCCRWLPTAYISKCHAKLGDRFTISAVGMPPLVFLSSVDDISAILAGDRETLHPGAGSAIIAPIVGERSFMLLDDTEHLWLRRTITPAFRQVTSACHDGILRDEVAHTISRWPTDCVIPIESLIRSLALRVLLRVLFGGSNPLLPLLHKHLVDTLSVTTTILLMEPQTRYIPGLRATWRRFLRQRADTDTLIYAAIHRRRTDARGEQVDLLDVLLAATRTDGSRLSDRELRDTIMSMILAGHETTTGQLSWTFQLLAHNPIVQQQLVAEVGSVSEDYLTATINETMRHKPVFLFAMPRKVMQTMKIGDWTYDPPAHLVACTYLMHHNPALYRDPYKFRPERFLEEPPEPHTWLPWGGGRKHCLGHHFALLEMKAILKEVLANRVVLPASRRIERPRWRSAIVVPHAGGRVILRKRGGGA